MMNNSTMNNNNQLFNNLLSNPYRILGIYGGVTEKEIHSKKGKIEAYCRVGKAVKMGTDFPFLPSIERDEQKIFEADKSISHNEGRFFNSLFWFINSDRIDKIAIRYLEKGEEEKALRMWDETVSNDIICDKHLSWYNNLGSLKMVLGVLDTDEKLFSEGVNIKLIMLGAETLKELCMKVCDKTYHYNEKKLTSMFIDRVESCAIRTFDKGIHQIVDLMSDKYPASVSDWYAEKLLTIIEEALGKVQSDSNKSPDRGYESAVHFVDYCEQLLPDLEVLLEADSHRYRRVCDRIAGVVKDCAVEYHNHCNKMSNRLTRIKGITQSIELVERMANIANSDALLDKINDDVKIMRENISY